MFEEQSQLPDGVILEARISEGMDFVLLLRRGESVLVEYSSKSGYEFKSVEKLRYDFERDVEDALHKS